MLNLASHLSRSAFVFPERLAVAGSGQALTYRQLDQRCSQAARGLRALGVRPGDTVALACGNRPEFVIAYYGILRAGAIAVPLNILFKPREFAHHLADAGVRAVICQQGSGECPTARHAFEAWQGQGGAPGRFVLIPGDGPAPPAGSGGGPLPWAEFLDTPPQAFDNHATSETDTAVILYTSGTTGTPKGAQLSHSNLALNAAYSSLMQKADSRDTHLVALPLFHAFGQTLQMNAAIAVGAGLVLMPRFDPAQAWAAMREHPVSLFAGVPTMFIALLEAHRATAGAEAAHPAPRWRLGMSGGAPLPVAVIEAFEQRLGLTLLEGYGLSETSPLATFSFLDTPRQPGSVGYPLFGTELRIRHAGADGAADVPAGDIELRGHHVMAGYLGRPQATAEVLRDGWLSTGDLGRLDEQGGLRIVDRARDLIIRGGYNVYPREVEDVLLAHPGVREAAVFGLPDDRLGQEVAAAVVAHEGAGLQTQALSHWLRERLAAYKYPRRLFLADALPRNATGKVLKQALRQRYAPPPGSGLKIGA